MSALTFSLASESFVYRIENRPEYAFPPDFVTVLITAPVKPPYSAGDPRPPT